MTRSYSYSARRLLHLRPTRRMVLKAGLATGLGAPFLSFLTATTPRHAAAAGESLNFRPSGDDGGGFSSVVVPDPFNSGTIISGQDTSGIWRSDNAGRTWAPAMTPVDPTDSLFASPPFLSVAAVVFSKTTAGKVYAGLGSRGQGATLGGLAASSDGGRSWQLRSGVVLFAGGNDKADDLPRGQLRSTGNLIQLDETRGLIYVATFQDGVMRSNDDGRTWVTLGLVGTYLRGLALDPQHPNDLYACPYGQGVWKTDDANGVGSFTRLDAAPLSVEEMVFVGRTLYAAGATGIYRSSDRGKTWEGLPVPMATRTSWISITGTITQGRTLLFAGAYGAPPAAGSSMCQCILRSTDGGASWEPITVDASKIHPTLGGPDGDEWWYRQSDAWPRAAMGGSGYIASYVSLDPFDSSRLYISGKAGVWRTDNALDASPEWYPCMRRLNVTFHSSIAVDDTVLPYRVYLGDTDWSFLYSNDGMEHVHINRFVPKVYAGANAIALLKTGRGPATVYTATEDQGSVHGEVFSSTDVTVPSNWTAEGLPDAVYAHYGVFKAAIGVAVNATDKGPVILAAVNGGGVWRKESGEWRQVIRETKALAKQSSTHVDFAWLSGSPFAFLYDRATGVWRSDDRGVNWSLIWNHPAVKSVGVSGFLLQAPLGRHAVWVSAYDGLYRLEQAESKNPRAVLDPDVSLPGPLAYSDGWLFVATFTQLGDAVPQLMRRSWPRPGAWEDLADDTYRRVAFLPHGLAVGADSRIFCAQRSMGVVVGVAAAG